MKRNFPHLLLFLVVTTSISISAAAQQFDPVVYYVTGPAYTDGGQIVTADFNNDGKLDLAMSIGYPAGKKSGVTLLAGNGDGTFQAREFLPVPSPIALAAADVNGDGIPDLLVIEAGAPGRLFVLLGTGNGRFKLRVSYVIQDGPVALAIADFNGDGHLDVAIANSNLHSTKAGYVSILYGVGNGTFQPSPVQYPAGSHPWSIAAGDLNADGHTDLVVSDDNSFGGSGNSLFILLNKGNGTFQSGQSYQTGVESVNVAIADFNHDGKPDLAVASAFDEGIYTLLGNGDGTFAAPVFYSTAPLGVGSAPQAVAVTDFNLDGNPIFSSVMIASAQASFTAMVTERFNLQSR